MDVRYRITMIQIYVIDHYYGTCTSVHALSDYLFPQKRYTCKSKYESMKIKTSVENLMTNLPWDTYV